MQVGSVATKITVTSKTDQLQSATSEKTLVIGAPATYATAPGRQ